MCMYNHTVLQLLYVPLCVGGSKASAGQYFIYFPATRAISREGTRAIYILPGKVVSLIHTLIFRMLHKKLAIIYIVELVTFTCGMEFCILTIIKNSIIFIVGLCVGGSKRKSVLYIYAIKYQVYCMENTVQLF